ncbi:MAG: LptF/LptG family permease [Kiritimatiellae bacterium]|nr:LptF/LptG family permease [Kiritimatiellia bacterium]
MRVLNRYLMGGFLRSLVMTMGVLTFVMYIGTVVKAIEYVTRGVSLMFILKIFAYEIPYTMGFVIPISVMTTTLLHFGRLSGDGEITAMKAGGISLAQIASPVFLCSIALSALCLWFQAELSPRAHHARREMMRDIGKEDPRALIQEGKTIANFPGMQVYIGRRDADRLEDIVIHQFGPHGIKGQIRAKAGKIDYDPATMAMELLLEQTRMTQYDQTGGGELRTLMANVYPMHLDLSGMMTRSAFKRKPNDMTFGELLAAEKDVTAYFPHLAGDAEKIERMRVKMATEASKRLALSLSCVAFTVLSVSLGLTSRRRQSSMGVGIALVLVFFFYLFIVVADSMVDHMPQWRPDFVPWIPVLLCEIAGGILLWKNR